jgi:hypothetical protein
MFGACLATGNSSFITKARHVSVLSQHSFRNSKLNKQCNRTKTLHLYSSNYATHLSEFKLRSYSSVGKSCNEATCLVTEHFIHFSWKNELDVTIFHVKVQNTYSRHSQEIPVGQHGAYKTMPIINKVILVSVKGHLYITVFPMFISYVLSLKRACKNPRTSKCNDFLYSLF